MKRRGIGQVRGELHPAAKLCVEDVALARLIAAEREQPKGWISEYATHRRVTTSAIVMAIGGQTWTSINDPSPVRSFARVRPGATTRRTHTHRHDHD